MDTSLESKESTHDYLQCVANPMANEMLDFHILLNIHSSLLGVLYGLLLLLGFFMLLRLYSKVKHPQPFIIVVHLLLIAFALFRVVFVSAEGLVAEQTPRLTLQIIGDLGIPALTSAFALTAWLMSEMTHFKPLRDNKLKKKRILISVIAFHFMFIIIIDIVVGIASTCWLLLICEILNILWGFTLTITFFIVTMKIYRASKDIEVTFRQRAFSKPVLEMTTGRLAFMGLVRGDVIKTLPSEQASEQDFRCASFLNVSETYPYTVNNGESVSPMVNTDMRGTTEEPEKNRLQITIHKSFDDDIPLNGGTKYISKGGLIPAGGKLTAATTNVEKLAIRDDVLQDAILTDSEDNCHREQLPIDNNESLLSKANTEDIKSEDVKCNSEKPDTVEEKTFGKLKQTPKSDNYVTSDNIPESKSSETMSMKTSLAPRCSSYPMTGDYLRNSISENTVRNKESLELKPSSGPIIVSNSNDKAISKDETSAETTSVQEHANDRVDTCHSSADQRLKNNKKVAKNTPKIIIANLSETHEKRKAKVNFNRTKNPAHKLHVVGFTSAGLGMVLVLMGTIGTAYIYNPLLSGTENGPNPFTWLIFLTSLRFVELLFALVLVFLVWQRPKQKGRSV